MSTVALFDILHKIPIISAIQRISVYSENKKKRRNKKNVFEDPEISRHKYWHLHAEAVHLCECWYFCDVHESMFILVTVFVYNKILHCDAVDHKYYLHLRRVQNEFNSLNRNPPVGQSILALQIATISP